MMQVKSLLDKAYSTRSMWPYFSRNKSNRLVFNLINPTNQLVATRSIGEVDSDDNYWDIDCVYAVGQSSLIAGGSFSVKRSCRQAGLGKLLLQASTEWMRKYSDLKVIFGDTVSRAALEMYYKNGALLKIEDVEKLCNQYDVKDLPEFFEAQKELEEIPSELLICYAWPLVAEAEGLLIPFGYLKKN